MDHFADRVPQKGNRQGATSFFGFLLNPVHAQSVYEHGDGFVH